MRNYFQIKAMMWTWTSTTFPGSTFYLVAFAGGKKPRDRDATLNSRILAIEATVRSSTPNAVFHRTEPQIIWWKLNAENFGTILHGISAGAREFYWNGNMLPKIPNGFTDSWLADITDTKYAGEKSPRKSWSHGE